MPSKDTWEVQAISRRKWAEGGRQRLPSASFYRGRYSAYSLSNNSLSNISILPASIALCQTTSSRTQSVGILRNNYQPAPVLGRAAEQVAALVRTRSTGLRYRVKQLAYQR